ncbi:PREDICTED: tetratricopeptide repeat protein 33 [Populus euphratica]|uniref:Tetratricopeptide repeat protein 33 n=1 Tax=Populus euphratica TaxID=75702 RepID=A0AAJ6XQS6_POPEU|nr:PREDICTED: tetratricopeptide repeat protein 33 [Populus euphratica]
MKVTWKKESKKRPLAAISKYPNLPFDQQDMLHNDDEDKNSDTKQLGAPHKSLDSEASNRQLADSFQDLGNKLAEDGKYREALGKWEAALNLMPGNAVLHEQKAQVLLEIGDPWSALKAATRATELESSWAEAWITLGRAQLNFGEPDSAIESFDKALAIKPDSKEAQDDRHGALQLVKKRKQLHSSGLSCKENRYVVSDKTESS